MDCESNIVNVSKYPIKWLDGFESMFSDVSVLSLPLQPAIQSYVFFSYTLTVFKEIHNVI